MTAPFRPSSDGLSSVDQAQFNSRSSSLQKSLPKVFESSDSPRAFREMFKERWAAYLKEHYKTPENVAVAFGVRYQTAVNWMDAVNRASGDVIALEATRNPEAFSRYMKGAA